MARTRPMASLARDIQLRPCRMIAVGRMIEVPLQVCRMAVGAHEVPGLVHPRPVQRVAGGDRLLGIEIKPPPPPPAQRTPVPSQRDGPFTAPPQAAQVSLPQTSTVRGSALSHT